MSKPALYLEQAFSHWPRRGILGMLLIVIFSCTALGREFLLNKEIDQIREAQEIDRRTELYLQFAALRMTTLKDRMKGIESKEGDPLEFYSIADLIYAYGRCIKAVESNLDEAVTFKRTDPKRLVKALNLLKDFATKSLPDLEVASQFAVAKKDEPLYKSVQSALEIAQAAIEGSTEGLKLYDKEKKKGKERGGEKKRKKRRGEKRRARGALP